MKTSIVMCIKLSLLSCLLSSLSVQAAPQVGQEKNAAIQQLESILSSPQRAAHQARDQYRNPKETLAFFQVQPHHSVVEIWPGGGWYAEILAPYLQQDGTYRAAHFDPDASKEYFQKSRQTFEAKVQQKNSSLQGTIITTFAPPAKLDIAPTASADRILTFRNVHNWYMHGAGEKTLLTAFQTFYNALKPGGILGVVEHRLPEHRSDADQDESGYMKQSYVIDIAKQAGFKFEQSSEINANAKDKADHPNGVWTLPPRLRTGDIDQAPYKAIGESDRMTLRFRKPNASML